MDDVDDAKRRRSEGSEDSNGGDGPEDELEIKIVGHVGGAVGFADGHGEDGVGDHPTDNHVSAHGAVVILLHLGFADGFFGHFDAIPEVTQGFVVAGVNVKLLRWHLKFDGIALAGHRSSEVSMDDVVALGAPGDVVRVTECVNLESADVAW